MPTVKLNEPQLGDIWLDKIGHHNLVIKIFDDGCGEMCASVLTLNTGDTWVREPFSAWQVKEFDEAKPFYHTKVG